MGRYYVHSTEAVWELIAREEWLGCRHDVAHVGHTRVNTSVGSLYTVFFSDFHNIKLSIYIYVYDFQNYTLYKRTLVVSDLVLARRDLENVFDRPLVFQKKCFKKNHRRFT